MVQELTPEEHLDYLTASIRLMLWFTWHWLDTHPAETFAEVVDTRVDIWRRTRLNPRHLDGPFNWRECPEWPALRERLEALYRQHRAAGNAGAFEEAAAALLAPYLPARVQRDLADIRAGVDLAGYQCGSLRYNLAVDAARPHCVRFHIANACWPASPFDDPRHFPLCFLDLMRQCAATFGVTEIGTGTWLNSSPKWLRLFPAEWTEHLEAPNVDVQGHYGFWGQFVTARRSFNHKLGRQFRETGVLPLPPRFSWCCITTMREHLRRQGYV
ncbi:MAG: hypothetical protein WC708_15805 [Lentisphaeria bacterium]